jgi:hypothetical protein
MGCGEHSEPQRRGRRSSDADAALRGIAGLNDVAPGSLCVAATAMLRLAALAATYAGLRA